MTRCLHLLPQVCVCVCVRVVCVYIIYVHCHTYVYAVLSVLSFPLPTSHTLSRGARALTRRALSPSNSPPPFPLHHHFFLSKSLGLRTCALHEVATTAFPLSFYPPLFTVGHTNTALHTITCHTNTALSRSVAVWAGVSPRLSCPASCFGACRSACPGLRALGFRVEGVRV